jgi:hypothetical protein
MTTTPSQALRLTQHRRRWRAFATAATVVAVAAYLIVLNLQRSPDRAQPAGPSPSADLPHPSGPPWRYGPGAARFTVIVYADLECPFCQSYTPELQQWIASQHDVNLQWHHLPLNIHQPAATQQALWIECVGEAIGHAGFWDAVSWVYAHTRSDGLGLPPGVAYPEHGSPEQQQAVRACLASERPRSRGQRPSSGSSSGRRGRHTFAAPDRPCQRTLDAVEWPGDWRCAVVRARSAVISRSHRP